jgi:hypothetical protein
MFDSCGSMFLIVFIITCLAAWNVKRQAGKVSPEIKEAAKGAAIRGILKLFKK